MPDLVPIYTPSLPRPLEREVGKILEKYGYMLTRKKEHGELFLLLGKELVKALKGPDAQKNFYREAYRGVSFGIKAGKVGFFVLEKGKPSKTSFIEAVQTLGWLYLNVESFIRWRYTRLIPLGTVQLGGRSVFSLMGYGVPNAFANTESNAKPVNLPSAMEIYKAMWGYVLPSRELKPLAPLPESHLSLLLAAGFIPYAKVKVDGRELEVATTTKKVKRTRHLPPEPLILEDGTQAEMVITKTREAWGLEVYGKGERIFQIFPQEEVAE